MIQIIAGQLESADKARGGSVPLPAHPTSPVPFQAAPDLRPPNLFGLKSPGRPPFTGRGFFISE
jgi:hypothetical protein